MFTVYIGILLLLFASFTLGGSVSPSLASGGSVIITPASRYFLRFFGKFCHFGLFSAYKQTKVLKLHKWTVINNPLFICYYVHFLYWGTATTDLLHLPSVSSFSSRASGGSMIMVHSSVFF